MLKESEKKMDWQEIAKAVIALNTWRREHPDAPLTETEQRAQEREQHTPGWYLQWWREREEFVLVPSIEPAYTSEADFLRVPLRGL